MSFQDTQPVRSATASSQRSQPPQDQSEKISQIEKSVTHLLVATKQLLEILTAWSRREATEVAVSDVYVRLGYEFNIACRAFNGIGVETSDLGPVPDLLRGILEDALSNEPSQASLEQYLPHIRDIIVNLLQGLKRKQQRLRQRTGRDGSPFGSADSSTSKQVSSSGSIRSNATTEERPFTSTVGKVNSGDLGGLNGPTAPSRISSAPAATTASPAGSDTSNLQRTMSKTRNPFSAPTSDSSKPTSETVQNPTYSISPPPQIRDDVTSGSQSLPFLPPPNQGAPGAQARPHDALAALQRGGELERRASRRFSAYQIQKHLGSSAAGIPMIPPSQHSPIPNRGRETREGMNAARMRGSPLANTDRSRNDTNASPTRQKVTAPEQPHQLATTSLTRDAEDDSPTTKTPEDKYKKAPSEQSPLSRVSAAVLPEQANATTFPSIPAPYTPTPAPPIAQPPTTPTATNEGIIVFLQYKNQIKKMTLGETRNDLSIASLQLAFIDKFAWNSHSNGADLPEIYIQDPVSGVRYELEDMSDVKNNSVLVLNVDALDEVKKHLDENISGLKEVLTSIRSSVDGQQAVLQLVSENQQDTTKSIARLSAMPPPPTLPTTATNNASSSGLSGTTSSRLVEVQSIRHDLASMRQSYAKLTTDMEASMADVRIKAASIKSAAVTATIPIFEGSSGRAYANAGRKTLSDDSEKIINRVDDLVDLVEDLRKDVVARGVRPLPRQLESVNKEISVTTAELKKLQEFIKREKPIWTKIWRTELEAVYDDQKALSMQEELAADLDKDLSEAADTFALVEEATKQQNVQQSGPPSANGTPVRSRSRTMNRAMAFDNVGNPQKAKDTVLGEVRALQPNHETRLEAIQRAEKARQRDLESRGEGAFKKELGNFVDEGRFKNKGGFEELEKARRDTEDAIRRGRWAPETTTPPDADLESKSAPSAEAGNAVTSDPRMLPSPLEGTQDDPSTENLDRSTTGSTRQSGPANLSEIINGSILPPGIGGKLSTSTLASSLREDSDPKFESPAGSLRTSSSRPLSPASIQNEPEFVEAVENPQALPSPPAIEGPGMSLNAALHNG